MADDDAGEHGERPAGAAAGKSAVALPRAPGIRHRCQGDGPVGHADGSGGRAATTAGAGAPPRRRPRSPPAPDAGAAVSPGGALGRFHSRPSHSRRCPRHAARCPTITAAPRCRALPHGLIRAHGEAPTAAGARQVHSSTVGCGRLAGQRSRTVARMRPGYLYASVCAVRVTRRCQPLTPSGRQRRFAPPRRAPVPAGRRSRPRPEPAPSAASPCRISSRGCHPRRRTTVFFETDPVDLCAPALERLLGAVPGVVLQGAGDDDGEPLQRPRPLVLAAASSSIRTPAARHLRRISRCQSSANHSLSEAAMVGPTPSAAASSSSVGLLDTRRSSGTRGPAPRPRPGRHGGSTGR